MGVGLCLNAAGATEVSDILNMSCWLKAASTILTSAIIPIGEIRSAAKGLQLLERIGEPLLVEGEYLLRAGININKYNSYKEAFMYGLGTSVWSGFINQFYPKFGLPNGVSD